jgi:hypothetical protein
VEEKLMFSTTVLRRFVGGCLIITILLFQLGCDAAGRLRKPIKDFADATSVVTAQVRLSYNEINRLERIRVIQAARRHGQRLEPRSLRREADLLPGEELATRLEALSQLEQHAQMLEELVTSDVTERIATSADELEGALNGLAGRIDKLRAPAPAAPGADTTARPDNNRFKEKFGVFSRVVSEVLKLVAKKKRDDALKRAISGGDAPVNDLIEAIKLDLTAVFLNGRARLDKEIQTTFSTYNTEISAAERNQSRLDDLEKEILDMLEAEDTFYASDPTATLDNMKAAHSKMVAYANQPTTESFTQTLAAVQAFVESATRLGEAVIKLRAKNNQNT